uniref:FHA domain-containing protein n=1 Tax=Macrostomum lignano TaxID=282301 RepID=A0A1I8FC96_9PLAT
MNELSDNMSSLESEVSRQAKELSNLASQRDERWNWPKAECESQGQTAAAEIDRLRDKLLADEELTDSLKTQIVELNGQIDELKTEANEKIKLMEQRDELNSRCSEDELQQLKEAKAAMNDRIIDMECELAAVKFDSDEKLHQMELGMCDLEGLARIDSKNRGRKPKEIEADRLMEQVASLNASKDEAGRQLAEAKAKADSANAALAEAESRADKSEKSAALLAQELAAAGAAVREKDAGASTKLKTNIAAKATDIAAVEGDLVDTRRAEPSQPVASPFAEVFALLINDSGPFRPPRRPPAPRPHAEAVGDAGRAASTPERKLNVKSPRSILRRQDPPSAKRRKRDNAIELAQRRGKSPASSSSRTTRRLVLSPTLESRLRCCGRDMTDWLGAGFDSPVMFGPVHLAKSRRRFAMPTARRIYPRPEADNSGDDGAGIAVPEEYNNEAGRRIYSERGQALLCGVQINRSHCRALRNFIISNSSKLEVMTGMYCGISTKVFNINSNTLEPNASIGVLRFKTTHSAYRFVDVGEPHEPAGVPRRPVRHLEPDAVRRG